MGMARYVVDAVVLEGRSVREVARAHGLSKTWIYELIGGSAPAATRRSSRDPAGHESAPTKPQERSWRPS